MLEIKGALGLSLSPNAFLIYRCINYRSLELSSEGDDRLIITSLLPVSPARDISAHRLQESRYARGWHESITMNAFG
jgi:hypothetical protein